ncbi:MAG: YchJ family metal-binding protein [Myxococcota bacterium]
MGEPRECPCSSGRGYAECCRPFHKDGVEAPTPEALMRSRYAAFALAQVDHLWRTLHSSNPDAQRPREEVRRELKRNCNRFRYPRLVVLASDGPDESGVARVLFWAQVQDGARDVGFVERSTFRREGGGWRYVDGVMRPARGMGEAEIRALTMDALG